MSSIKSGQLPQIQKPQPRWLLIDDTRNLNCDNIARTYEEGLFFLRNEKWDVLCIDHDLGEEDERKNGYTLINIAIEEGVLPRRVQIVSSNPVGVKNIALALMSSGYTNKSGDFRNFSLEE